MARTNEFGQTIGLPVANWTPRPQPGAVTLTGRHCRLEPLDATAHAADLFAAYRSAGDDSDWTYLSMEPFGSVEQYREYADKAARSVDPRHFAVIDASSDRAIGTLALLRIDPANGVIEVGSVAFSPLLKQSTRSTEAHYLLMAYAFDVLGYRRYEWKCDDLNGPSRKAAERLGFQYEGTFRRAAIYKGRNRDTAWYSIIGEDWPTIKAAFDAWLSLDNFDVDGKQHRSLATIRATA